MASTKQDGDKRTLTDMVYILTICHACMPVCRQCSIIYVVFQENLLVWHKISKCTTPQEQNWNLSPQKKRRKTWKDGKTLIESSWKVKESPLNCNRTGLRFAVWDVCFIGINRLRIKSNKKLSNIKSKYKETSPNNWAHFQPTCDLGSKGQASPFEQTRFIPEGTQGS